MLQLKHTFLMGLFQSLSLGGMAGIHFPDHDFITGLHLPNCSCTWDFHLFDGLSSLSLISPHSNFGILHQLPLVGVQGGLSGKQPLQGCVHLPLQLKHLTRQASCTALGAGVCGLEGMLVMSRVFNTVGGEAEWLTRTMLGACSNVNSPGDAC